MHRINDSEAAAAHRIFNRVEQLVGPYHGFKTKAQTRGYVSENRWIMYPMKGVESLREGTTLPLPNMFLSYGEDREISDNGRGESRCCVGVTYHNVQAMEILRHILRRQPLGGRLVQVLRGLGNEWTAEIQRKTQTDCPGSTPHYETYKAYDASKVTAADIAQALKDSDRTLRRNGDIYPRTGTEILWEVSVFTVWKDTDTATYAQDVRKSFKAMISMTEIAPSTIR